MSAKKSKIQKGKVGTSYATKGPAGYDMGDSEFIVSSLVSITTYIVRHSPCVYI